MEKRMKPFFKQLAVVGLALVMLFGPGLAEAQATALNSAPATVTLSLTVSETVTVSATPANITFSAPNGGASTASGPISVVTSWNGTSRTSISTVAWFNTAGQALAGPISIAPSSVFASINGGTATACTQATPAPVTGIGLTGQFCPIVFTQNLPPQVGTHTDTILLSMSGLPALAAGTYTGTLNIEAQLI
jgi:hypothetical protein